MWCFHGVPKSSHVLFMHTFKICHWSWTNDLIILPCFQALKLSPSHDQLILLGRLCVELRIRLKQAVVSIISFWHCFRNSLFIEFYFHILNWLLYLIQLFVSVLLEYARVFELFEPIYNHSFEFFVWKFFCVTLIGDHCYGVGNFWTRHAIFFLCVCFCTETFASEVGWLCEFFLSFLFFYPPSVLLFSSRYFIYLFIYFTETVTMFGESIQSQCPALCQVQLAACLFSQPLMCVDVSLHIWAAYPRVKAGPLFTSALCYGFLCTWAPTLVRLWPAPCSHSPCCISEPWCSLGHFP